MSLSELRRKALDSEFAKCEVRTMEQISSEYYHRLRDSGTVSPSYAHEIANGKRAPSLKKALEIYRATGLKFGPLRNAPDRDIPALERVANA